MRKQNSKIGRPRKVIRQGKAKVTFTGKNVTAHAGMALKSGFFSHSPMGTINIRAVEKLFSCS